MSAGQTDGVILGIDAAKVGPIGDVEAFEVAAIRRLGEWTCSTKQLVAMARDYDVGFSPRAAVRRMIRKLRKAGKLGQPVRTLIGSIWTMDLRS